MIGRYERQQWAVATGIGAWAVGTGLFVALGSLPGVSRWAVRDLLVVYPRAVVWSQYPSLAPFDVPALGPGLVIWGLLCGAGALAVRSFDDPGGLAVGVSGVGIGGGHGIGVTVVVARTAPFGAFPDLAEISFLVVTGGFVLPAALATVGAVLAVVVEDPLGVVRI